MRSNARVFAISPNIISHFLGNEVSNEGMLVETKSFQLQSDRLTCTIDLLVHMLGPDLDQLMIQLHELGVKHAKDGLSPKHLAILGEALMGTLSDFLKSKWTPEAISAWLSFYKIIASEMLRGAKSVLPKVEKKDPDPFKAPVETIQVRMKKLSGDNDFDIKPRSSSFPALARPVFRSKSARFSRSSS